MTPVQISICEQLGAGDLLSEILAQRGMPSRPTFYRWLREDEEFGNAIEDARNQAADFLDELVHKLADMVTSENASAIRVQLDALRWRAAKLHPARYASTGGGTSVETNVNIGTLGEDGLNTARAQLEQMLDRGRARLVEALQTEFPISIAISVAVRELEASKRRQIPPRRLSPAEDYEELISVCKDAILSQVGPIPYFGSTQDLLLESLIDHTA
jgi:hypothetical protein